MAYADRDVAGSRVVATVIVSVVVFLFAWAFVTGLTSKFVKQMQNKLNTFDVAPPPPPPPPDKPPPPPPDTPLQPPPVVAPPPAIKVQSPPPPIAVVSTAPPFVPVPIAAPPAPPAPPTPVVNRAAGAKGDPAQWITNDDYPADALRAEASGTTAIAWDINTEGRVENCHTTSSSGNTSLDQAACRALTRRARYSPALDQSGNPIRSTQSRRVRWQIPQ